MHNNEKLRFAINQILIQNPDKTANEDAIKAVKYLQEVAEDIRPKKKTKIEAAIYDAELHVKDSERKVLIETTILNERRNFVSTLESIKDSKNF